MFALRLAPAIAALVLSGCSSSDSGDLFDGTGSPSSADAAAASGGSGGVDEGSGGLASQGGASGAGGAVTGGMSGGGAASGGASGGAGASGGGTGAGASGGMSGGGAPASGGMPAGGTTSGGGTGAGASTPDSGVPPVVDAATPVDFPAGGVVSQECAECVTANCPSEVRTCNENPECWQMGTCVTSCFIPLQCAACFVGDQQARADYSALQCCSQAECSMCPSLGGLLACN